MSKNSSTDNELFKNGYPCTTCLTRGMCRRISGEGNVFDYITQCDLPEKYNQWKLDKDIRKFERAAKKGDKKSVEALADTAKELLKENIEWWDMMKATAKIHTAK